MGSWKSNGLLLQSTTKWKCIAYYAFFRWHNILCQLVLHKIKIFVHIFMEENELVKSYCVLGISHKLLEGSNEITLEWSFCVFQDEIETGQRDTWHM